MKIEIPWETSNKDSTSVKFEGTPHGSMNRILEPVTQEQSFEEEVFSGSRTRVNIRTDESLSRSANPLDAIEDNIAELGALLNSNPICSKQVSLN